MGFSTLSIFPNCGNGRKACAMVAAGPKVEAKPGQGGLIPAAAALGSVIGSARNSFNGRPSAAAAALYCFATAGLTWFGLDHTPI